MTRRDYWLPGAHPFGIAVGRDLADLSGKLRPRLANAPKIGLDCSFS